MFDWLLNIDHQIFAFLNGLHADWMDPIQYWISNKYIWIPFYVLLLAGVVYQYKKKAILIISMVITLVATVDQTARAFKYGVERQRPSSTLSSLGYTPHTVNNYYGKGNASFYSAHASNSFAIAVFIGTLLMPLLKGARKYLIIWASIVAYSRIYLGVHFPSDITVGAITGVVYGCLFLKGYSYLSLKLKL